MMIRATKQKHIHFVIPSNIPFWIAGRPEPELIEQQKLIHIAHPLRYALLGVWKPPNPR
jgi:hypothetical protein